MPPPPLSLLADRCRSMAELKRVHAQMLVRGRARDNFAYSRLVAFAALSPQGDLPYAMGLFRQAQQEPNTFIWNTLIRAHAAGPSPAHALLLFLQMLSSDGPPPPGKHTFPFLLKACANSGAFTVAVQAHAQTRRRGLAGDVHVANGLVRCYGLAGRMKEARQVFDEMPEPSLVLWTTMLSAYAQNQRPGGALRLFREMVAAGAEPGGPALASALAACAQTGGLGPGRGVHAYIIVARVELGVILGTALLDMYAKNGAVAEARRVFRGMPEKNVATWNAMIGGLAGHGRAEEALELFEEMEGKVAPNEVTFVGVLSACCHAGLVQRGRDIFLAMKGEYGLGPKVEHFACVVDLLGRSGRLGEAEEVIQAMDGEEDVVVLGALLAACRRHGEVDVAERVVRKMLELDSENHGVFVVLSNMYAEAGRWKDVERMRKVMVDGGLRKVPAWSCVDVEK